MSIYLAFVCLLASFDIYCTDLCYTDYSKGSVIVYHKITGGEKNGRLSDLFNVALSRIVPVVPPLVALGKFIVNRIKDKKK